MKIYESKEIALANLGREVDYELSFPDSINTTCWIVMLVAHDGDELHTSAYRQRAIGFVEAEKIPQEDLDILNDIREKKLNKDA